ncbi:MAG: methyltransferase domain-containing protein [Chlamydiia bacterium]|nr:methyltransferase domain-containing protein [Chlamydiia bacterium]
MVNYFSVKFQDFLRQKRVEKHYYDDEIFAALDQKVLSGPNPFKVSKRYLQEIGESNVYQYGETPLETLEIVGKLLNLQPCDHLVEMGCGRGRGAFFLNHFFGCRVTGIEQIPAFVSQAVLIAQMHRIQNIEFRCENMLKTPLNTATCVYLYGTCLDETEIQFLAKRLAKWPLRVVTTSYPLEGFEILNQAELRFPWGLADVFINQSPALATCAK